jgi:hypothetical protein
MYFSSAWHLMDWNIRLFPFWTVYGAIFGNTIGIIIATKLFTQQRHS